MSKIHLSILLVIIVIVYCCTFNNPLVFDSIRGLEGYVRTPIFFENFRSFSTGTFYELYNFTHRIEAQRGVNLIFHLVNTVLIYILLGRFYRNDFIALAGSIFFGLNPAAIFAVAYLIQRSILMVVMFGLLQILFLDIALKLGRLRDSLIFYGASVVCYYLAMRCKQQAIPLAVIYLAWPIVVSKKRWLLPGGIIAALGMEYAWNCTSRLGYEASYYNSIVRGLCGWGNEDLHLRSIATQTFLFFKYAYLWLDSFAGRSIDMRVAFAPTFMSNIYWVFAFGLTLLIGVVLTWRKSMIGVGLILLWILFLPEILTERIGEIFVLYRSYLFAIGYVIILGGILNALKLHKNTLVLLCVGGGLILAPATFSQLGQFKSATAVWQQATNLIKKDNPEYCQSARIYNNLGAELIKEKRAQEAVPYLSDAVAISGDHYGSPIMNLGTAYIHLGNKDKALECFEKAAQSKDPGVSEAAQRLLALEWK